MISNSKILTVSYGTFSCTLEGFDDSFGTMKAIAEYFRDLAANDRYFGAEPPTPDAEMLARIAEREIARRVEAHEQGGKIVLRAHETPAEDVPAARKELAPMAAPAAQTGEQTAAQAAPQPAREAESQPGTAEETLSTASREDAPVARAATFTAPQPPRQPAAAPLDERAEPQPEKDLADEAKEPAARKENPAYTAPAPAAPEPVAEKEEQPTAEAGAEEPVSKAQAAPEALAAPAPVAAPAAMGEFEDDEITHPDPGSVAAKLRRIRSVVAQSGADYGFEEEADQNASEFVQTTATELEAVMAFDDAYEQVANPDAPDQMPMSQDSTDARDDRSDDDGSASAVADASAASEDTLAQLMADAMPEAESPAPTPKAEAEPLDARVVKVKRAELEELLASQQPDEAEEDRPEENLFSEQDTIGGESLADDELSPEEEAELQRELAEVEAELGIDPDDDAAEAEDEDDLDQLLGRVSSKTSDARTPDADEEPTAPEATAEASDDREDAPAASDPTLATGARTLEGMKGEKDVSRIFDEADTQSEAPENSERRSAIQHLRAAVAATRAEKDAGGRIEKDVDDTPYRSDLANVVRPRRPSAAGAGRAERPSGERPAPLKLVAEQRVDLEREPVQPRRVTTFEADTGSAPENDGSSFAEYAEAVGAHSLAELLEAAAAYMADVEGRPQFSRPMLMGKLKEVERESFTREDGLRSFGLLLRQGKLQKLNGGRFAITDATDFRAQQRNAG